MTFDLKLEPVAVFRIAPSIADYLKEILKKIQQPAFNIAIIIMGGKFDVYQLKEKRTIL